MNARTGGWGEVVTTADSPRKRPVSPLVRKRSPCDAARRERLCGPIGGGIMPVFRIGEAARLLGVSDDTLRRWTNSGRVTSTTTESGQRGINGRIGWFATERVTDAVPRLPVSACNQLSGLVTRIVRDQVMAQVEIQVGSHRIVSLMSSEAVDELGLEPGVVAVATMRSTSVIVTLPQPPRNDPTRAKPAKRSKNV